MFAANLIVSPMGTVAHGTTQNGTTKNWGWGGSAADDVTGMMLVGYWRQLFGKLSSARASLSLHVPFHTQPPDPQDLTKEFLAHEVVCRALQAAGCNAPAFCSFIPSIQTGTEVHVLHTRNAVTVSNGASMAADSQNNMAAGQSCDALARWMQAECARHRCHQHGMLCSYLPGKHLRGSDTTKISAQPNTLPGNGRKENTNEQHCPKESFGSKVCIQGAKAASILLRMQHAFR